MRFRPTPRAVAPATDRPSLTLVRDEPAPVAEAVANAAKIDPTILDETRDRSPASAPPLSVDLHFAPHACGPVIGQLERFADFSGPARVAYRYMDERMDAYLNNVPDFGADPEIEQQWLVFIGMVQARVAEIRRTAAARTRADHRDGA